MLVAWMMLAMGVFTGVAWWDSSRESEAVLLDVGSEQSVAASIAASSVLAHLMSIEHEALFAGDREAFRATKPLLKGLADFRVRDAHQSRFDSHDPEVVVLSVPVDDERIVDVPIHPGELLGAAVPVERTGDVRVLVAPPNGPWLYADDGRLLSSPLLREALDRHLRTLRLTRESAREIGLRARTAMAGLAEVDAGPLGRWGVVAVGTAAQQRDRETRAFWRLVVGIGMASALVVAFGGIALQMQRKELELERVLAVWRAQHEREEELARAERAATMGTFALGIVHEVASPLGVIMGRAEQLRGRAGDERSVYAATAIMEQVDRIQVVIRRFLDMARGGPPSLSRTNPGDLVRSAASSVEHRFEKARVSLAATASPDMAEIHCDRALLERAIVNLLLNACDACDRGGHVELAARADAERVVFIVTDDGSGITQEHASRAREPFFTTKPAGAGTGLGLAISSEIAKSHRGKLTIAPNAGRGTRACIEIPAMSPRALP